MTHLPRTVLAGGVPLACRYVSGHGPTIVFVSGLGDPDTVWDSVLAHLPDSCSTFTYDRAGCGDSQPLPGPDAAAPRPASWAANQLRQLLLAAQVAKPWVLVGHSIGGLVIEAFAYQWPADVAGLVLVDASDPALDDRLDTPKPLLADGDKSAGWLVSMPATRSELEARPPSGINTVVIGSAVWRWLRVEDAVPFGPLTLAEVDQHWQLHQLRLAQRWDAPLVVPHVAGHRVHEEEPALVAHVVQEVARAAAEGDCVRLNQASILSLRGTVRTSTVAGRMREWDAAGPRPPRTGSNASIDEADLAEIEAIRQRGPVWIGGTEAQLLMDAFMRQADREEPSPDEAAAIAEFEQRTREAVRRLKADPAELASYRAEAHGLAEVDIEIKDSE